MVDALGSYDTIFLLAVHPPKAPHLCEQSRKRPQLCPHTKGEICFTHGYRYRPPRGNGRRFTHVHIRQDPFATDRGVPLVSDSQHHGDAGKLGEEEPAIKVPIWEQPFPPHQRAVPAGRMAPHPGLRHRHRTDAHWALVRKHEVWP